jgi:hypothetical protein
MDIRLYSKMGYKYNRESDERVAKLVDESISETDWEYVRNHMYTDDQRRKLENFDTLAKQMKDNRFGFFSKDGTVLSGIVTGFSWNKDKVVMDFHLRLDRETDANISYSVSIQSGLQVEGDTVIITDDGIPLPFDSEGVPANSLKIAL